MSQVSKLYNGVFDWANSPVKKIFLWVFSFGGFMFFAALAARNSNNFLTASLLWTTALFVGAAAYGSFINVLELLIDLVDKIVKS